MDTLETQYYISGGHKFAVVSLMEITANRDKCHVTRIISDIIKNHMLNYGLGRKNIEFEFNASPTQ